jgi:hypothetical protein
VDFFFELLIQLIIEVVTAIVFDLGLKAAATALLSRTFRWSLMVVGGLSAGVWWGLRLSAQGRDHEPNALWVSLSFALIAVLLYVRISRKTTDSDRSRESRKRFAPPWRWAPDRLIAFALLNVGVAVGIAVAFRPA